MVNFSLAESDASVMPPDEYELGMNDVPCTDGSRPTHPQPWCGQHLANGEGANKNFYNYTNQDDKEKTPMCRVAELARFHKLKYKYKLMDESGPAHKKLFTVQLVMNPDQNAQQVFEGSGASIKKAQQAAADEALKNLSLPTPPEKIMKKKKDIPSAVNLLAQVVRRMNLQEPSYRSHPKQRFPPPRPLPAFVAPPMPLMLQNIPPPPQQPGKIPFMSPAPLPLSPGSPPMLMNLPEFDRGSSVSALVCGKLFTGFGANYTIAKENAASQALMFLTPALQQFEKAEAEAKKSHDDLQTSQINDHVDPLDLSCFSPSGEVPKHRQKSVISHVHECALQMKLNVQFEVLLEEGPPHERTYLVKCALLNANNEVVLEDTGDGRKKKEATQAACCNVLNKLRTLESSPLFLATNILKSQKRNGQPKEQKKKTIVKDMKMDPSYGHQINPVSRLIQVLQARGEPEPTFTLVGEHGQSRYKEFVMEVCCGERYCSGSGPNKRLAKRAAAEAMLAEIGYVKPLPPPGKSLLKKRNDPMLNIGVFDLNEMMSAVEDEKPQNSISCSDNHWELSVDASSPPDSSPSSGHSSPNDGTVPPSPGSKRRVTFNSQVKACPPPEDANYPQPEVAPLKADVVVEGRLKRLRKAKEGKRKLSEHQQNEIVDLSKQFLSNLTAGMYHDIPSASRQRLEECSEKYKFSVQFTNFPKSPDGSDPNYFALVSLGLEKPLVCHGSGMTVDDAADNAAFNAIISLSKLNDPQAVSPVPQ